VYNLVVKAHSGVIHNIASNNEPFDTATRSVPHAQSTTLFLAHSHVITPISPLQVCSVWTILFTYAALVLQLSIYTDFYKIDLKSRLKCKVVVISELSWLDVG
jgi:hypothetical protein